MSLWMNNYEVIRTNNIVYDQNAVHYVPQKPVREYSALESIFAWICVLAGYIFCHTFPVHNNTLGGFVFVGLLFAITAVFLKIKGKKFGAVQVLSAFSAIAVCACLILSSNSFLHTVSYAYALTVYCYFLYSVNSDTAKKGISDMIVVDYFIALFLAPFFSFASLFKAMFSGKGAVSGKFVLKLLIGICIAIIPTAIVLALLSYDNGFTDLLNKIFDFSIENVFYHIFSLIFAIPIGMYIFGLFISAADNKCKDILDEDSCKSIIKSVRIAPMVTILAAVIPLIFVYVVFFISQWKYYVSPFSGSLPQNFSYADYAREGFFQLCIVSTINFGVILLIMLFMQRNKGIHTVVLRMFTVIFSFITLVLMSTAVAKMIMYIDCYGLTQKRVYATWFMVVLALLFIIISIRQFVPKIKAVALSAMVCVVLFTVLTLSNVDAIIAGYNVDRYINGTLETVDIVAMDDLDASAIPELVRLAEYMDETNNTDITHIDENMEYDPIYIELREQLYWETENFKEDDSGVFSMNIPKIKAEKALKDIGLL